VGDLIADYLEAQTSAEPRGNIILSKVSNVGDETRTFATVTMLADGGAVTWTDQPAALTEFLGATRHRTKKSLLFSTKVRLIVNVTAAGADTPAKIRAQYSTDQETWYYLDGVSGPSVDIYRPLPGSFMVVSDWVDLAVGAKVDVVLRLAGIDGDGAADPAFGSVFLEFA